MTNKEKVIGLIQSLDDDVCIDEVIDRLYLLRKIQLGIEQADRGEVVEHDEFMDQLEASATSQCYNDRKDSGRRRRQYEGDNGY